MRKIYTLIGRMLSRAGVPSSAIIASIPPEVPRSSRIPGPFSPGGTLGPLGVGN